MCVIILVLRKRKIPKRLDCRNFGTRCDYTVCAHTEQEATQRIGEHIQAVRGIRRFSKEFYQEALATIHEEKCEHIMRH